MDVALADLTKPMDSYVGKFRVSVQQLWRYYRVYLGALLFIIGITSCGFKLRGTLEVAPTFVPLYVQTVDGSGVVAGLLKEKLLLNAVPLTTDPKAAKLTIRILEENSTSTVSSIDRHGKAIGNLIHYHVVFDAVLTDGSNLIDRQLVEASREYVDPAAEVLGKAEEAAVIKSDLEDDITDRIISQLRPRLRS